MTQPLSFIQQMNAEIAAANGTTCGVAILDGSGYVCLRKPHDVTEPHVGHQLDGSLVQWSNGT